MAKKIEVSSNFSWLGLLGVIFVVCKVLEIGVIATWSWWLVLLPFYIGLLIIFGIVAIGAFGIGGAFGIAWIVDTYRAAKLRKEFKARQDREDAEREARRKRSQQTALERSLGQDELEKLK